MVIFTIKVLYLTLNYIACCNYELCKKVCTHLKVLRSNSKDKSTTETIKIVYFTLRSKMDLALNHKLVDVLKIQMKYNLILKTVCK